MTEHLSETELLDLIGGETQGKAEAHLRACADCARRLQDAREGLVLARMDALPEPAAEDWGSFQADLKRRIEAAEARRRRLLVPALAAAAVLVAALSVVLPRTPLAPESATLPAWTPLPPREADSSLWVLEGVFVAADDLSMASDCRGVGDCLASLSDEETAALAEVLRQGPRGDGL